MSDVFNSKQISFIDMLGGEHRRSKVYASCLEVLRKLGTYSFCFRGFKVKNTLRRCIQGSKTRNNLQRRYLQIKNEEVAYESQISSLNAKNTGAAMSLENETSQVRYG